MRIILYLSICLLACSACTKFEKNELKRLGTIKEKVFTETETTVVYGGNGLPGVPIGDMKLVIIPASYKVSIALNDSVCLVTNSSEVFRKLSNHTIGDQVTVDYVEWYEVCSEDTIVKFRKFLDVN